MILLLIFITHKKKKKLKELKIKSDWSFISIKKFQYSTYTG